MKIRIRYFAAMREKAGKSEELVDTKCSDARELYTELNGKYAFNMNTRHLKLSLNRSYADWSAKISEGDEVVFIPPVAGG